MGVMVLLLFLDLLFFSSCFLSSSKVCGVTTDWIGSGIFLFFYACVVVVIVMPLLFYGCGFASELLWCWVVGAEF